MGFEPMNNGFAIRPLSPLGYAAGSNTDRLCSTSSRGGRRAPAPIDEQASPIRYLYQGATDTASAIALVAWPGARQDVGRFWGLAVTHILAVW